MKLRIVLHVFEADAPTVANVEAWEIDGDFPNGTNPLLLHAEHKGLLGCYLFSQEKVEANLIVYHPVATMRQLPLIKELPKFGWHKVKD